MCNNRGGQNRVRKCLLVNEAETKAKLERALGTRISLAEWQSIKDDKLLRDYQSSDLSWVDFRGAVDDKLRGLRQFLDNVHREQDGELELGSVLDSEAEEVGDFRDASSSLSYRTRERLSALASLNRLRTNGRSSGRLPIHGTLLPRGGVDGTLAQWVYIVAVELWMPAEEVMEDYRSIQRTMLSDPRTPKTQSRALKVAKFVWDNEIADGERAPWPELWQRWNNSLIGRLVGTFEHWRDFRRYFIRGEEATLPRYLATNKQITDLVRQRSHQRAFDMWASEVRE
jgi:hypothetical protein